MKNIYVIVIILLFFSACSKDSSDEVTSQANNIETSVEKQTTKADEKENNKEEDTSHAGHDHAQEANPNDLPYVELETPYATETNDKVVVYEFFGYTCGHCYNFEPQMTQWVENKPDYVEVVRVPLNFQQGWGVMQQGYLTASSMGIAEENHRKLFAAIHQKRTNFRSIEQLATWYADNSEVNKEQFLSTAKSFIIDSQQRKADKMGYMMKVTGTPTIVVNGKYKPTNKLKSRQDVLEVMSELVEIEAKEMGLISP